MSTHAIERMATPVGFFGATKRPPPGAPKGGGRLWAPVLCSAAVHAALVAGAWMIEIPERTAAPKDEIIEVSLLAGPGPGAPAGDEGPGLPEAPPPPPAPVRRAAPPRPAPKQAAPKVLAVAPKVEEKPAPKDEVIAEAPLVEDAVEATEEAEAEAAPEPEPKHLLDGALADASGALHGVRGGGGGGGGGGLGGGGGGHPGGSPFGSGAPVDGATAAVPPRVLERVQPEYPRMARRRGIEGVVVLRLVVDREGRVEPDQTRVLESVPGLDKVTMEAAHRWRFTPARDRTGAPVRSFIHVPFRFTLQ